VAIVGAGITGALLADALTGAGKSVVVLDRRPSGQGSTAACTGILSYEVDVGLVELAERLGEARAVRSYQACVRGVGWISDLVGGLPDDCGFAWKPSLYLAHRKRHAKGLEAEAALRERHGFDVELLNAVQVRAIHGLDGHAALRTTTAAVVDAVRLTRALLDRARRRGAVVCTATTMTDWSGDRDGATVGTTRGRFHAGSLVFATGYETPPGLGDDIVQLNSSYALASFPLPEEGRAATDLIIWNTERPYFYLRPAEGNRVVIGGGDVPFRDAEVRDRLLPGRIRALERRLEAMFPTLRTETEHAWAGTFGETRDGLPYVGACAGFPAALFALGYGGNGMVFSAVAAEILRGVILGEGHGDLDLFAFDRE
jgi:glycine/D-amino acid oxidase-like deaminating enzyme